MTLQLLLWGLVYQLPAPDPQLGTPELLGHTLTTKVLGDTLCSFWTHSFLDSEHLETSAAQERIPPHVLSGLPYRDREGPGTPLLGVQKESLGLDE